MVREATFLGTVQDVKGATIRVALDPSTVSGVTFVDGETYRIGQVGSFVRIPLGYVSQELMAAPSQGRYLVEQIKGTYRYARV